MHGRFLSAGRLTNDLELERKNSEPSLYSVSLGGVAEISSLTGLPFTYHFLLLAPPLAPSHRAFSRPRQVLRRLTC
jgi:hypothetical protein